MTEEKDIAKDKALWILVGANLAIGAIVITSGNIFGVINVIVSFWIWAKHS